MKITPIPSGPTAAMGPQSSQADTRSFRIATNATPQMPQAVQEMAAPQNEKIETTNPSDQVVEATQPLGPQYAKLAKVQRALQVKERELQAKIKAFEQQSQGRDVVEIAKLKENALRVLRDAGISYDQLTQEIIADQSNPEISALNQKLQTLEQSFEKRLMEKETASETQQLNFIEQQASALLQGDEFELTREFGEPGELRNLAKAIKDAEGHVPPVRELLQELEEARFKSIKERASRIKKLQSLISPETPQQQVPQRATGMRTLTTRDTANAPMDKRQRAVAVMLGTLKR